MMLTYIVLVVVALRLPQWCWGVDWDGNIGFVRLATNALDRKLYHKGDTHFHIPLMQEPKLGTSVKPSQVEVW